MTVTTTEVVIQTDAEPEIDQELLAEAQRHLGGVWPHQAINAALAEYVAAWRARRRAAHEQIREMDRAGLLDWDAIDEVDK